MALYRKIRGMPLVLLVLLQLLINSVYAQDLKNRTEEMYHLGKVVIANQPLPDKVFEAQKRKFLVSVTFFEKGTENFITNSLGTGFVSEVPGIILTARHVLKEALTEMEVTKQERIKSNPKFDYDYMFMGTIITDAVWINFPLSLVATGELGTFKDVMALRMGPEVMNRAYEEGDIVNSNPYKMLLRTSEFADAEVGETAYITGFAPIFGQYANKNNKEIPVYIDMINYTFAAEVTAKITDMPVNKADVKVLYRLRDGGEPGFSGGMVLNGKGKVVGMTVSMASQNFIYVISSKDIKQFLKDNHLK